jgi:transcriptional regulator with XRE-family HTH domain
MQTKDHFQQFISDPKRRRVYEREALAFEASELISRLMENQGVNKSHLAACIGTSKSHVTNLLSGSRNMTLHTVADLTFALGHRIEIKATPLCAAACWTDFDEQEGEAYSGGWGLVHSNAYKSAKTSDPGGPSNGGHAPEECLFAAVA